MASAALHDEPAIRADRRTGDVGLESRLPIMHTLAFLEPGHFHAALTLGTPHPNVREEIFVYAPPGAELDDFLALIDAFNRRAENGVGAGL